MLIILVSAFYVWGMLLLFFLADEPVVCSQMIWPLWRCFSFLMLALEICSWIKFLIADKYR